jgi:hypothetical protein
MSLFSYAAKPLSQYNIKSVLKIQPFLLVLSLGICRASCGSGVAGGGSVVWSRVKLGMRGANKGLQILGFYLILAALAGF